ncbi:MAG: hypothetical protein WHS83_04765 [Chloroflexus sp.]|uniref:hypothetical protein n=1 Tax=Chloroflexus sp. TaxID=1904827 RepID=UPI00309CCA3D
MLSITKISSIGLHSLRLPDGSNRGWQQQRLTGDTGNRAHRIEGKAEGGADVVNYAWPTMFGLGRHVGGLALIDTQPIAGRRLIDRALRQELAFIQA